MVVQLIEEAKAGAPDLHFEEVDVTEHPEVAVKYRVMATPALVINGRLEFRGIPKKETLWDCLRKRRIK